jgi:hypothetical protein
MIAAVQHRPVARALKYRFYHALDCGILIFALAIFLTILCWLVGLSAVWAASEQIRTQAMPRYRTYLIGVLLWVLFLLIPLYTYMLISYPSWSLLYWYNSDDLSPLLIALGLVCCCGAAVAGFWVGYRLLYRGRAQLIAFGMSIGILAVSVLLAHKELFRPFEAGSEGIPLWDLRMRTIFALAMPVIIGGWVFLIVYYRMEGNRMRRGLSRNVAATLASANSAVVSTTAPQSAKQS